MTGAVHVSQLLLIATGGTISMVRDGQTGKSVPALTAEELLARTSIDTETVRCLDLPYPNAVISSGTDLLSLAQGIARATKDPIRGVVVTHGTDTLEEVAYGIDEMLSGMFPIVFTGAMRPSWAPAFDGIQNLEQALQVAAVVPAESGTLVTMQAEIFEAWSVYKADTQALGAFTARRGAVRGRVAGKQIEFPGPAFPRSRFSRIPPVLPSSVPILTMGIGDDAALLRKLAASDMVNGLVVNGLVVASMGAGSLPPAASEHFFRLAHTGVPVVCCSSVPSGPTAVPDYYPGAYAELHDAGILIEDYLSPRKARIRLMISLGLGVPYVPFGKEFA